MILGGKERSSLVGSRQALRSCIRREFREGRPQIRVMVGGQSGLFVGEVKACFQNKSQVSLEG